jgi:hypothetical protein
VIRQLTVKLQEQNKKCKDLKGRVREMVESEKVKISEYEERMRLEREEVEKREGDVRERMRVQFERQLAELRNELHIHN